MNPLVAELRRTAVWPLTFLGFPPGGLVAKLTVGSVDSTLDATLGGMLAGGVLGGVQWLALRRIAGIPARWVALTSGGMAIGLSIGATAVGFRTDTPSLMLQGLATGAGVGLAQAAVVSPVAWKRAVWLLANLVLWPVGWAVTARAGVDVEAQYTNFGAAGAVVFALATWLVLASLRVSKGAAAPAPSGRGANDGR